MTRRIPLNHRNLSMFALVDDKDYPWLSQWEWKLWVRDHTCYAYRYANVNGKWCKITMHRAITKPPRGYVTDHENHNGLDNRRDNLRVCTQTQNCQNQRKARGKWSSVYKGTSWNKGCCKWDARIRVDGRLLHLGLFDSEHDAARAYNAAALEYFGEFARLNVIAEAQEEAA